MLPLIAIARQSDYVREAGDNKGLRVEAIQHAAGGSFGDSWCVEMFWVWIDFWTKGNSPFPRGLNSEELRQLAISKGWQIVDPEPGCCVINIVNGRGEHTAMCTEPLPLVTIAGNTSPDGLSTNGDGVHEHPVSSVGKFYFRVPNPNNLPI
jgi:hypothetical protein